MVKVYGTDVRLERCLQFGDGPHGLDGCVHIARIAQIYETNRQRQLQRESSLSKRQIEQ